MNSNKELIYVGDPMCSWCYGFSEIKKQLVLQCKGRAEVRYIAGGLHTDWTNYWDQEYRDFLRDHWIEIGNRSGQPFKLDILSRKEFVYNTGNSCRAVITTRQLEGDLVSLDFFSTLQKAFYAENLDITDEQLLIDLAVDFGLSAKDFTQVFTDEETKVKTLQDYERAHSIGVTGFPTVVLREGEEYGALTVGYREYEYLRPVVEAWLEGELDISRESKPTVPYPGHV